MTTANLIAKYAETFAKVEAEARKYVGVAREDYRMCAKVAEETKGELAKREDERDKAFDEFGRLSRTVRTLGKRRTDEAEELEDIIEKAGACKQATENVRKAKEALEAAKENADAARREHEAALEFWVVVKGVVDVKK